MASLKKKPQILTKNDFDNLDECDCGRTPFKYHNTSNNTHVAKCAYFKHELDLKTKKWSLSKKQPCGTYCIYHSERPVFKQIENTIINTIKSKPFTLEDRLRSLFRFLYITDRTTIIQEIDLIVKNTLKRQPRKVYYYPSTTIFPKVSHHESFKDYETRIFSEKIIDRTEPPIAPVSPVISQRRKPLNEEIVVSESESESDSDQESELDSEVDPELEVSSEVDVSSEVGSEALSDSEIGGLEQNDYSDYDDPGDDYDYSDD